MVYLDEFLCQGLISVITLTFNMHANDIYVLHYYIQITVYGEDLYADLSADKLV
jgi:hypothetical protein